MAILDDLKAKIDAMDHDENGRVKYDDVRNEADKHGFGDHLNDLKDKYVGEDGKLSADDAKRALSDLGDTIGNTLSDAKDKLFGGH